MSKTRRSNQVVKLKTGGIHSKLRKEFGDLPIIEGLIPLRLQPMQCDVETALPKDPANCVFARAASRQYGATKVIFWRNVAYVDLVGRDGVRHVERFYVPRATFRLIESFDRGEPLEEGRAFHLNVPRHSTRLDVITRRSRAHKKTPGGRAIMAALASKNRYKTAALRLERDETLLEETRDTAPPRSPKVKLAAERVASAKIAVREAKSAFETAAATADKFRERKPIPRTIEPKTFDLSVRSGKHRYNFSKRVTA